MHGFSFQNCLYTTSCGFVSDAEFQQRTFKYKQNFITKPNFPDKKLKPHLHKTAVACRQNIYNKFLVVSFQNLFGKLFYFSNFFTFQYLKISNKKFRFAFLFTIRIYNVFSSVFPLQLFRKPLKIEFFKFQFFLKILFLILKNLGLILN